MNSSKIWRALISFIEGYVLYIAPATGAYVTGHISTLATSLGIAGAAGVLKVLYNYFVTKTI